MKKLIPETSERLFRYRNWIKEYLESECKVVFLSFEGYTIKNNKVSALLDRRASNVSLTGWAPEEILHDWQQQDGMAIFDGKCKCAELFGVPFYFVIYHMPSETIEVYQVQKDRLSSYKRFASLKSFGSWMFTYRDLAMKSKYEETGLPEFDKKLRKIGLPWPGNLNGTWYDPTKSDILALIEFQTTIKVPVKDHCSNKWFLPSPYRKGDEQRWLVLDIPRKQLKRPLIIIVWSPNEWDKDVKIKEVDHIVYSHSVSTEKPGLYYKRKVLTKKHDVFLHLETIIHKNGNNA